MSCCLLSREMTRKCHQLSKLQRDSSHSGLSLNNEGPRHVTTTFKSLILCPWITGRILGFVRLEFASVPETLSFANSCFVTTDWVLNSLTAKGGQFLFSATLFLAVTRQKKKISDFWDLNPGPVVS